MKILAIILLSVLFSCRTVKNIETVKVVTDSTAAHQRDSVIAVKKQDSAAYTAMIESLSNNTIIFQDTGSTRTVTKVEYYPDGSLKTVEGNLRSVTSSLSKKAQEAAFWRSQYDSLAAHKDSSTVQVRTETKEVVKNVKRGMGWGWTAILVIAAFLLGIYFWEKNHKKIKG